VDLRQLRYFTQIVESGSLSKASRQLFIAQPALSQQISKLESEVGKPLFSRSSKGVVPTENGLALYHHARFMLRQLEQALSIARKDSGAVQGMVSVGLPATTVSALGLALGGLLAHSRCAMLVNGSRANSYRPYWAAGQFAASSVNWGPAHQTCTVRPSANARLEGKRPEPAVVR